MCPALLRRVPGGRTPALVCVAKHAVSTIPTAATASRPARTVVASERGAPPSARQASAAVATSDAAQARRPATISPPASALTYSEIV